MTVRQLVLIGSLVATLLYTGAATEYGKVAVSPLIGMDSLADALRATGAAPERVIITGWIAVPDSQVEQKVRIDLGWTQPTRAEIRELRTLVHNGNRYLTLRWEFAVRPADNWEERFAQVRQALSRPGGEPNLTVQLEGTTVHSDPVHLVQTALNAVNATRRQPWVGPGSASLAGLTSSLPAGPYPANIQVAARTDPQTGRVRVWVAWPALQQEY